MDEWQVLFSKFMELRVRSKDGETTIGRRLHITIYY